VLDVRKMMPKHADVEHLLAIPLIHLTAFGGIRTSGPPSASALPARAGAVSMYWSASRSTGGLHRRVLHLDHDTVEGRAGEAVAVSMSGEAGSPTKAVCLLQSLDDAVEPRMSAIGRLLP